MKSTIKSSPVGRVLISGPLKLVELHLEEEGNSEIFAIKTTQ